MILLTGAAGFIGSCVAAELYQKYGREVMVVDDFRQEHKINNLKGKKFTQYIDRELLFNLLPVLKTQPDFVIHLGARTDTAETDTDIFDHLNLNYSKKIWNYCAEREIPLIYASSAATYGGGEHGFKDEHSIVPQLRPLNAYGQSKQDFDLWALEQEKAPPFWAGLKFFNIYGPNEYHKGRMASVVFHAFNQITETGAMKLFRSHHPDFENGEQLRDFVYVKDLIKIILWMMEAKPASGLYNLGTGKAKTFLDLTRAVFHSLGKEESITFVDTPEDIRDKYQYFTEADITKLLSAGYSGGFSSLEEGIEDYVGNYLVPHEVM